MPPTLHLGSGDTIVFTGDSITAADRHRQAYRPLGFGYVHFAGNLLLARHPELELRLVNTGVSGDTITDLQRRWQQDCLDHRPDVLSVLIGINDVWQRTMEPDLSRNAVDPGQYELTYAQLLAQAQEQSGCRLVLMEPFLFCRDRQDSLFQALTPYVEAVRRLAEKYSAALVPLQREIDRRIVAIPPARWSRDRVHPDLWAHAWIAQQWLEATGL